jgi:tRNA 2-thiouridine synthesizing protein A
MTQTVDARGLSCPQPVLITKNAIDKNEFPIEVLVDTVTSRENVRRMALSKNKKVSVEETEDGFKLLIDS